MDYDVYSYGMISASTLYVLKNQLTKEAGYAEIGKVFKMTGGEAANSSVVLRSLGISVRLDGNWLSADDDGYAAKNILDCFKIDVSRLKLKKNYLGAKEVILSNKDSRVILGTYGSLFSGRKQWNIPVKNDIAKAKIVSVDPFFKKESLLVAQYARRLDIPCVTVDCKYTDPIFKNCAITILAKEFLDSTYKNYQEEVLFNQYLKQATGLVVFTSGSEQVLFGRKKEAIKEFKPYKVKPIDTTGAGDSFRAGMIYGALQGWADNKSILFASALAALICLRVPGVLNSPSYKEVVEFIKISGKNKEFKSC